MGSTPSIEQNNEVAGNNEPVIINKTRVSPSTPTLPIETMKLEQQVCGLEFAKRLKELGVNQDAFLVWDADETKICRRELYEHHNYFSAFSVAELGEMLKNQIYETRQGGEVWNLVSIQRDGDLSISGSTEADARAKMLIYLLERKPIQASE